jgi:hypothetical protein
MQIKESQLAVLPLGFPTEATSIAHILGAMVHTEHGWDSCDRAGVPALGKAVSLMWKQTGE